MGKGRQFELDIVSNVNDLFATQSHSEEKRGFACTLDYSGVASDSAADVLIAFPYDRDHFAFHLIELKKRSGDGGKRLPTHPFCGSSTDETGLEELQRLVESTPVFGRSWVGVNVDNRRLAVFSAPWLLHYVTDGEHGSKPFRHNQMPMFEKARDEFAPRLTPADNISMVKPDTGAWPSATASPSDAEVLLTALDVPNSVVTYSND
jgi:hypothetical protein